MMLTNLSGQTATTNLEEGVADMTATTGVVGRMEEERGAAIVVEVVEERRALIVMEAVMEVVALPTITTKSLLKIVTIIKGQED